MRYVVQFLGNAYFWIFELSNSYDISTCSGVYIHTFEVKLSPPLWFSGEGIGCWLWSPQFNPIESRIAGLDHPCEEGSKWGKLGQWSSYPLKPGLGIQSVSYISSHSSHENDDSEKKNQNFVGYTWPATESWAGFLFLFVHVEFQNVLLNGSMVGVDNLI